MKQRDIRTKDLLQLPTAITAGSFALVVDGSRRLDTRAGKAEVMVGRAGDVVDGIVARKLDMSSDAGAIMDATCDKLGMLAIAISSWHHSVVPKPILVAMAAKHTVNAAATLYNGLRDQDKAAIRPPVSGKFGMAADNIAIGAFLLANELPANSRGERIAQAMGYVSATVGLVFGAVAARHYLQGEFDNAEPSA